VAVDDGAIDGQGALGHGLGAEALADGEAALVAELAAQGAVGGEAAQRLGERFGRAGLDQQAAAGGGDSLPWS
jgi:hypothetical protein